MALGGLGRVALMTFQHKFGASGRATFTFPLSTRLALMAAVLDFAGGWEGVSQEGQKEIMALAGARRRFATSSIHLLIAILSLVGQG